MERLHKNNLLTTNVPIVGRGNTLLSITSYPVSQEALMKLKISFVRVMSAIKTSLTKTGLHGTPDKLSMIHSKNRKSKISRTKTLETFPIILRRSVKAGLVLTRNNFVYKKTE